MLQLSTGPQAGESTPFHVVDPSPWPFVTALATFISALGGILWMHRLTLVVFWIGVALLLSSLGGWWRDVVRESRTVAHTVPVQKGLRLGMLLFIISEVAFFGAFFWSFFDASLFPAAATGGTWPPVGITPVDPFQLPYLNTLLLLLSATSLTWAHHSLLFNRRREAMQGLGVTVGLGVIFLLMQAVEYYEAPFTLKDGVYAANFYLPTGFHGAHVLIGAIFLTVCLGRLQRGDFTPDHHVGFEAAAWYWHFVDVVWLFLFVALYLRI